MIKKSKSFLSLLSAILVLISGVDVIGAEKVDDGDYAQVAENASETVLPGEKRSNSYASKDTYVEKDDEIFDEGYEETVSNKTKKRAKSKKSKKSKKSGYGKKVMGAALLGTGAVGLVYGMYKRYVVRKALGSLIERAKTNAPNYKGINSISFSDEAKNEIELLISLPKMSRHVFKLDEVFKEKYNDNNYSQIKGSQYVLTNALGVGEYRKDHRAGLFFLVGKPERILNDFAAKYNNGFTPLQVIDSKGMLDRRDGLFAVGRMFNSRAMIDDYVINGIDESKVVEMCGEVADLLHLLMLNGYCHPTEGEQPWDLHARVYSAVIKLHEQLGDTSFNEGLYGAVASSAVWQLCF